MGRRAYAGGAAATTLTGTITSGATAFAVTDASNHPASGAYALVIDRGLSGEEKLLIGSRSGNNLTVTTRGYDGTTAASHNAAAAVELCGTAIDFDEANAHVNATSAVHGLTGAVVGTTDTQTLTNKTLTTPVIASISNTGTLTLPTSTDTLVGRATTDTLTNKTLTSPTITSPGITGTTTIGAGATLTSPTLTTPTIADFTNATHTHHTTAQGSQLAQADTHQSPDTDTATSSLHHTIGTSATQAAAGNHTHSGAVGSIKTVRKTSDQAVNNSTTLVNDTELLFAVAANEVWSFDFWLINEGDGGAAIKFAFTIPSGATLAWSGHPNWNTSDTFLPSQIITASASPLTFGTGGATTKRAALLKGIIRNGATPGNLQLQFAQNAAVVANTQILTDSYLAAVRLA